MLFGRYIFSCVFQDEAVLPPYKGSTFRGAFGHALKKVVCALRRNDCDDCLLKSNCVYAFVFESHETDLPQHAITPDGIHNQGAATQTRRRIAASPHPYVIEPFNSDRIHYRAGEMFDFTLLLFGKANDYLPHFIYAIEQMGRLGIGKAVKRAETDATIEKTRGTFLLTSVAANDSTVYDGVERRIANLGHAKELNIMPHDPLGGENVTTIEIALTTPLRLKYENRLQADLPFHVLIRAMLRRISALHQFYDGGEPPLDYRGLVERAKDVATDVSNLHWYDWRRYSNRQDQAMLMGGMTGKITYMGKIHEYLPLIRFCEQVHIGKQTSFGLGRIEAAVTE